MKRSKLDTLWTVASLYSAYVDLYPSMLAAINHGPALHGLVFALRFIHQYV